MRSTALFITGFLDCARNDKKNILTRFNGLETSRTRREKKAGRNRPLWSLRTAFFDETQLYAVYTPLTLVPR
jgi:hypothetical protein